MENKPQSIQQLAEVITLIGSQKREEFMDTKYHATRLLHHLLKQQQLHQSEAN